MLVSNKDFHKNKNNQNLYDFEFFYLSFRWNFLEYGNTAPRWLHRDKWHNDTGTTVTFRLLCTPTLSYELCNTKYRVIFHSSRIFPISNSILSGSITVVVLNNHSGIIGSVSAKTKDFYKLPLYILHIICSISEITYHMKHMIWSI